MDKLLVIKVGGNIIDDEEKLSHFLKGFAAINDKKILVHGGGKLATKLAESLGIKQQMIEGRRITDTETLKVVTMVYAGFINKNMVAQLQSEGCNAIGICGADGNAIRAHKRVGEVEGIKAGDYGFVGDVDVVNAQLFQVLLQQSAVVVAPITHDGKAQLLNTNADTVAQSIATALCSTYNVQLIYGFEKAGVLQNADDEASVIKNINRQSFERLKNEGVIHSGMIPKLQAAFDAIEAGVNKVVIGHAENLSSLTTGESGTSITND